MSYFSRALKRVARVGTGFVCAAALSAAVVALPAQAASASAVKGIRVNAAEARMLALVNASRSRVGLPRLTLAPGYTDVARRWSRAMAARHTLVHNPSLASNVTRSGGATWRTIGENVAFGYRSDVIFGMYMRSAPHRANILSRSYRYVGVGWVETPAGPGYTTLVFSSSYSSRYGASRVPPARCVTDH